MHNKIKKMNNMAEYNNVQIRLRIDSKENWTTNNTVLANGEVGIVVDGSSIDLKAGHNGASFTSLPYLVGDNAAITNLGSRIDTANDRINTLQGNVNLELVNNYTTSRKMLDEHIPGTGIVKRREIESWAEWTANGVYPQHRLTDAVSWDSIFIILKSLKEAGLLPITDENAVTFGEKLKQHIGELSNIHETAGRDALDLYRNGILG